MTINKDMSGEIEKLFEKIEGFNHLLEVDFGFYIMTCILLTVVSKDDESKFRVKYSAKNTVKQLRVYIKDIEEKVLTQSVGES